MLRLAFLVTHPIQYHAPLFRHLAAHGNVELEVLYCHQATPEEQGIAGFGKPFQWDVPLFDGYAHRFLNNVSRRPSIGHFGGLDTPGLKSFISERQFDAVVVHGWHYKSAWQAIRACWKTQVPVLVRSDSHRKTPRSRLKRAAKWPLYRCAIPKFDACLPVGDWSREYFLHYGADPSRVFVVPHSVDSGRLLRQAAILALSRDELRRKWRIAENHIVWAFVGKFVDKKRPLDFIAAIHQARQSGTKIWGLMVGDGPLREQCEAHARDRNVPIRFSGFLNQSEISQAYCVADALAVPSEGETWGLVVNEAMVFRRPCVVSDQVGCGPDLIEEGVTGSTFRMGDINELADVLKRYSSAQELAQMGERAHVRIRQHSVQSAASALIAAVRCTVGQDQKFSNGCKWKPAAR